MLTTIEEMKDFLCTLYGNSTKCVGSKIEIKFQGLCQGSDAAPAGWATIGIPTLKVHKKKGHGAHFVCSISNLRRHLAAIMFVGETSIVHMDMYKDRSVEEKHYSLHEHMQKWGKLLMATGGAVKLPMCLFYLISCIWQRDGSWVYADNKNNEELNITVPLPDGLDAPIDHLSVGDRKESLGVPT